MFLMLMIGMVFMLRIVFIITGMLKGPVLKTFEQYGPEDPVFCPLPELLFWPGVIILSGGTLLARVMPIADPLIKFSTFSGGLLIFLGCIAQYRKKNIIAYWNTLPVVFPGWYKQLLEQTSRQERRRIAYMWLWLPRRTRLLYNANNRLFFLWAEQIIVATVS